MKWRIKRRYIVIMKLVPFFFIIAWLLLSIINKTPLFVNDLYKNLSGKIENRIKKKAYQKVGEEKEKIKKKRKVLHSITK